MLRLKNVSDKNNISLDLVCYLISTTVSDDNIGNQLKTPVERLVYCAELPVNSSEFYNAGQTGIKPEHLLVIDLEEYDGETALKYEDKTYSIYRTYPRGGGLLELYCNKKVGVS